LYAVAYRLIGWLYPVLRRAAPRQVIRSDELAAGMIEVVRQRPAKRVLDSVDLRGLLAGATG
jgi:hypothetical protein